MNLRYHPQQQVLRQRRHLRPVFDIRSKLYCYGGIRLPFGIKDTIFIYFGVEIILIPIYCPVKFCGWCQYPFIGSRRRDGAGIHQCHGRNLSTLQLGAFPVREVTGRMPDTESIVSRCIPRPEARAAECSLQHGSCLQYRSCTAILYQLHIDRHGGRIDTQCKAVRSDGSTFQDICRRAYIFESAAGTACDNSLIHMELTVPHFFFQGICHCTSQAHLGTFFHISNDIHRIFIDFCDRIRIAGMERHSDHRLHFVQIYSHQTVIVCHSAGCQLRKITLSAMDLIELLNRLICLPDGR